MLDVKYEGLCILYGYELWVPLSDYRECLAMCILDYVNGAESGQGNLL